MEFLLFFRGWNWDLTSAQENFILAWKKALVAPI